MNGALQDEYKAGLRTLLQEHGSAVELGKSYHGTDYDDWFSVWEDYSTYGWQDYDINEHLRGQYVKVRNPEWKKGDPSYKKYDHKLDPSTACSLVIPEGVEVKEVSYSEFQDTFSSNKEKVGVNAYGGDKESPTTIHCACGKYSGIMVRWEGSLMEALQSILGLNKPTLTL